MKLKNRKTGETGTLYQHGEGACYKLWVRAGGKRYDYTSLAKLNEDWEDVLEKPKGYWYLRDGGNIDYMPRQTSITESHKEIGNYFETKEEAQKAVEKLKALRRLKDKGFKFEWWKEATNKFECNTTMFNKFAYNHDDKERLMRDLNLLFWHDGSEE